MSTGGGTWLAKDIPILFHTFEYMARHALLKWWREGTPEQEPSLFASGANRALFS